MMEMNVPGIDNKQMALNILIDGATSRNWGVRFAEVDRRFQTNWPYFLWDNARACVRIDEHAREQGRTTSRASRSIQELKAPWLPTRSSTTR
jgi:hypothetical protein